MFILKCHLLRRFGVELIAVVQKVPTQAHLQIEVAQVEVDGHKLSLELVVADVIADVAVGVDVNVVTPERVTERGTCKAAGMDGEFTTRHHALSQTQRDIGIDSNFDTCLIA